MTDMIAAEPAVAARILERHEAVGSAAAELARVIRRTVRAGEPVVVTGCGTSEHAALGVAEILREAVRAADVARRATRRARPVAAQAFELSLDPPSTRARHRGLARGRDRRDERRAGGRARLPGRGRRSSPSPVARPGAALADLVVETGELDQSWCHTVGYLSPLVAAAAVGAHLTGRAVDAAFRDAVRSTRRRGRRSRDRDGSRRESPRRRGRPLVVIASGADRTAGRELALKIEEGGVDADGVPRPRDVPARPPAGDGRDDRGSS